VIMKLRRLRWGEHVARMGRRQCIGPTEFWWGNLLGNGELEDREGHMKMGGNF
jgi:hypothetical protein